MVRSILSSPLPPSSVLPPLSLHTHLHIICTSRVKRILFRVNTQSPYTFFVVRKNRARLPGGQIPAPDSGVVRTSDDLGEVVFMLKVVGLNSCYGAQIQKKNPLSPSYLRFVRLSRNSRHGVHMTG